MPFSVSSFVAWPGRLLSPPVVTQTDPYRSSLLIDPHTASLALFFFFSSSFFVVAQIDTVIIVFRYKERGVFHLQYSTTR